MSLSKERVKQLVRGIKRGEVGIREGVFQIHSSKAYRQFKSRLRPDNPMSFKEFVELRLTEEVTLSVANKEIKAAKLEDRLGVVVGTYKTAPLQLLTKADDEKLELVFEAALDLSGGKTLTVGGVEEALELYGYSDKLPVTPRRKLVLRLPKEPAELLGLIASQYTEDQVAMLDRLLGVQFHHHQAEEESEDGW